MPTLGGLRREDYRLLTRVSYKTRPHRKSNKGKQSINQTTTTTENPRGKITGKLQAISVV